MMTQRNPDNKKCEITRLLCRLYNAGYQAGHEDTVEGNFTLIHWVDRDTYHDDIVDEIHKEWAKENSLK